MGDHLVLADHVLEGFATDGAPIWHDDAAILIRDGRVERIGDANALGKEHPDLPRAGGRGIVVIPGLVNAHHHVGLTPFQLGSPDHPLELWFASRLALRDIDLRLDTLFSAFEMIASGVTTVQHLHSRAAGDAGAVIAAGRTVMDAYREIGMRASYSMALRDQNRLVYGDDAAFAATLPAEVRPAMEAYFRRFTIPLAEQLEIFEALRAAAEGERRIAVQIAPANLHWLSDAALEAAATLHRKHGLPLHMHILETPYQKAYAKRRTGGSALAFLDRFGLVGRHLTIGHGVWMTEDDIALCAERGAHVCHNCSSNFRLKSGIAPVNRFLARGIPVAIGIDEAGLNDDRDMMQEMRLVLRAHREPGLDAAHPTSAEVLRMATEHGAATTPFSGRIGSLARGREADLVMLDWQAVTYPYQDEALPRVDVIVHRARTGGVKAVMVAGEMIYADGRFARISRDAVLASIHEALKRPRSEAERDRIALSQAVFPHVRAFYDGWLDGEAPEPFYRPNAMR
jgi:cytosine/adenosine deaminase-related metal-dependent hydrolase